jgi:hypothetical protein
VLTGVTREKILPEMSSLIILAISGLHFDKNEDESLFK